MGLLEVLRLVFVGGSKVSNHATVVAGDDNTTLASGLDIVDEVFGVHAGLFTGVGQDIGVLVFADAANEDDRVFGEDVLGHSTLAFTTQELKRKCSVPEHLVQCSGQHHRQSTWRCGSAAGLRTVPCACPRRGWHRWL